MESFDGSKNTVSGVVDHYYESRTIRVILGWDFKQRRKRLLVLVDRRPDLLRDLMTAVRKPLLQRKQNKSTCWFMSKIAMSLRSVNS